MSGRTSKAWEALQNTLSQTVETVTRASRVDIVGGGVDEIDPPEDIDQFAEQAKTNAIVRANLRKFVHDVWEPGYRVEGPEETVQYFEGDQEDIESSPPEQTPNGGFLHNAAVFAGERHQNFYSFGKECTWQRWVRGTVLVEYLKQDPTDPESQISGFSFIRPETVYPQVENNTNILLEPDFADLPEDISRRHIDTTKRDEVAAYIQFDDESILGLRRNGFDEQDIPLSQNDVLKQTLEPDIGGDVQQGEGVFGTSVIEPVSEDIEEYEQTKRDRFEASRRKAYGIWTAQFSPEVIETSDGSEVIEWQDDAIDATEAELNKMGPGDVLTSDAKIDLERHSGEVPELDDMLMHYVKDISSALPTPLPMAIDFAGDINRDVTSDQREGYTQTISEARQYQETSWTQALRFIADRAGLPTEGLEFKIQPEKQDNPIKSLETDEIERMNTYITTLNEAAGPQAGPTALVSRDELLEVLDFPTDSEQSPEDSIEDVAQQGDEAARDAWNDIMGVKDVEALDFTPELHPRDDEGKFTEAGGAISNLIDGAFEAFGDESERGTVESLTQTWAGWPTDSNTAPMWKAAEEQTFNDNAPTDITGTPLLQAQADPSDVSTYEEYSSHVSETLQEVADGDTITAHRFLHGEAAERLRNGESLPPRTLASWTTDENTVGQVIDEAGFDAEGNPIEAEDAVVVTKEIPIENVADHHAVNPELNNAGQNEAVIALPGDDDLSDGDVREATEVVNQS